MCVADNFPALKWFSEEDTSGTWPIPVSCYRVDKSVQGFSWSDWASWYKLAKLFEGFPP